VAETESSAPANRPRRAAATVKYSGLDDSDVGEDDANISVYEESDAD